MTSRLTQTFYSGKQIIVLNSCQKLKHFIYFYVLVACRFYICGIV